MLCKVEVASMPHKLGIWWIEHTKNETYVGTDNINLMVLN